MSCRLRKIVNQEVTWLCRGLLISRSCSRAEFRWKRGPSSTLVHWKYIISIHMNIYVVSSHYKISKIKFLKFSYTIHYDIDHPFYQITLKIVLICCIKKRWTMIFSRMVWVYEIYLGTCIVYQVIWCCGVKKSVQISNRCSSCSIKSW